MEALSFMKFWLLNTNSKPRREIRISESAVGSSTSIRENEVDLYEEDDSFFELEISLPDFSLKACKNCGEKEEKQRHETTTFSVSKNKILPLVEIASKPTKSLNDRFKTTSFRKTASIARSQDKYDTMFMFNDSVLSSKRFFNFVKPLYAKSKTTKKQSSYGILSSPAASPAPREKQWCNVPSGIQSVRRQLRKSRSGGMSPPPNRVDVSLLVQQDGIQSAILHCKKSFQGSRESSMLSRSTSESSSREKLSTSSSEDSYLFSRIASDSMSDISIDSLASIKEQREKISD